MNPDRLVRSDLVVGGAVLAAYDSGGNGVPIIFQHGLCGDIRQIAEAVPDAGFRLLAIECRGHGASPAARPPSIARFADDVIALIEARGLSHVLVGGISMGAAIASRIAVTRPDLVRGLILARPAWVVEPAPANMAPNAEVGRLLAAHSAEAARAAFMASPTHARLAASAPDNLASLMGFFARAPQAVTADLLTAISADGPGISELDLVQLPTPTLVLASEEDAIHPLAHAERLARLIPQARLERLTPKGRDKAAYLADFHRALTAFAKDLSHA
jgi:pimeloyl-ACP methyl ester carboxylesterase